MKSKLTWISVIVLVVWFNFAIVPMGQDYASKIEKQAVRVDTLMGVQYKEGQGFKLGFHLMDEEVDVVKVTDSMWQAYNRYTGKMLWERKTVRKQTFVLSTKYLLEIEEDSRGGSSKISGIDLKTGHVIWVKELLLGWQNIDVSTGNSSILLEYNDYDRVAKEWISDSTAYQIIEGADGEVIFFAETKLNHKPLSKFGRTVDFDAIRRLKISWENMDYYASKNIFFSKSRRAFYQGAWYKERVKIKEIKDYWVLHYYGTPYIETAELLLLPKSKNKVIPRFLDYDARQKVKIWDNKMLKVVDRSYNYYALDDGVIALENQEWRKSTLLNNESWLTTKASKAEWMIEQSETHLYLNNILNLEQKSIQMNQVGTQRYLRKNGDWLYIYEVAEDKKEDNRAFIIYRYKLPINYESQ
jgi:hypothetical protein